MLVSVFSKFCYFLEKASHLYIEELQRRGIYAVNSLATRSGREIHKSRLRSRLSFGMWISYCVIVGILVCVCHWVWYKRVSPVCKNGGVLPPGSMGLPLIGETIQLIIPSYSLDIHPFFRRRVQRYITLATLGNARHRIRSDFMLNLVILEAPLVFIEGKIIFSHDKQSISSLKTRNSFLLRYGPIFRTCLVGQPIVVSVDPEFNNYILNQEGKSTELWYLRTLSKLLSFEGDSKLKEVGRFQNYCRGILLKYFGSEVLRDKLLPRMEETTRKFLEIWSSKSSVEVKSVISKMTSDFAAKLLFSYDSETSSEDLGEEFACFFDGLISFPLNLPGTTYNKCLKGHKRLTDVIRKIVRDRMTMGCSTHNDFLDQAIKDMKNGEAITEERLVQIMFVGLFASSESLSTAMSVLLRLISDNNTVVEQLKNEHASILHKRGDSTSMVSWEEYKSMSFTTQVVNESLWVGNLVPGIFRRAVQDIQIKGMTIPAGWTIMLTTSDIHMNRDIISRPSEFNPSRWKELDWQTISRNFMPFGSGRRQCVGADYSRAFLCMFLHVLVTEFRWTITKGGTFCRNPILGFKDNFHVKFTKLTTME